MKTQARIGLVAAALCVSLALPSPGRSQATWREVPELSERNSHRMAYDPIRKRVVLYGGQVAMGYSDTWEWDGRTWHVRRPSASPGVRAGHMMAYDPVRKTVLLFGGATAPRTILNDTWEWDGQTWRKLNPKNSPPARSGAGMATDFKRGRIVLFGGFSSQSFVAPAPTDTWEWDGTDWIQRFPKTSPPGRGWTQMAYNPVTRRVTLAGGYAQLARLAQDTWEWDGTDWIKLAVMPGCRDPQGCPIAMATDASGKGVYVLIPGVRNARSPSDTHLLWDGKAWTALAHRVSPPRRWYPEPVADLGRKETLLFGGGMLWMEVGLGHRQDTWAWNGSTWRVAHEWITPRYGFLAAYDAARDEFVILEGGRLPAKTWVFRDGRFLQRKPPTEAPGPGFMLYHAALRKVFNYCHCFGTWLWDGRTWTKATSKMTGPTGGQLVYDSRRHKVVGYRAWRRELWEWDESGWSLQYTGQGPRWGSPSQEWSTLGYDPARGRLVAVGGKITQPPETWEWDGKTWSLIKPRNRPSPRLSGFFRYVPALGGCVLFGGLSYINQRHVHDDGTWLWDGKDWTKLAVPPLPKVFGGGSPVTPQSAAYDTGRQRLVAFYVAKGAARPGSLAWELLFESLKASQRYPRPGESFQMNAYLPAQPGRPFLLLLSGGRRPGIPLRPVPHVGVELLPLRPDGLFWASLGAGLVTVLDRTGKGTIRLKVPNDTRLHWTPFHAAGLSIDPLRGIGAITNRVGLEVVQ